MGQVLKALRMCLLLYHSCFAMSASGILTEVQFGATLLF